MAAKKPSVSGSNAKTVRQVKGAMHPTESKTRSEVDPRIGGSQPLDPRPANADTDSDPRPGSDVPSHNYTPGS